MEELDNQRIVLRMSGDEFESILVERSRDELWFDMNLEARYRASPSGGKWATSGQHEDVSGRHRFGLPPPPDDVSFDHHWVT
jgi:hypothetical protein